MAESETTHRIASFPARMGRRSPLTGFWSGIQRR